MLEDQFGLMNRKEGLNWKVGGIIAIIDEKLQYMPKTTKVAILWVVWVVGMGCG